MRIWGKVMDKKILVGSIIAVAILVGVSFTSVLGYRSVESNMKESPLFNIRTSRAIGEEDKELTCSYVGIGNTLPFPKRDGKSVMVQKVVDNIRQMDDESFEKFVASVITHAKKDKRLYDINPDIIRESLYLVRDSDKLIPVFDDDTNHILFTFGTIACGCQRITFGYGFKGIISCLLLPFIFVAWYLNCIINQTV